jgi:hypothetical protein
VFNRLSILVASVFALSACASHEAVRVECNGPLRPINRPVPVDNPTSARPSSALRPLSPPMSEAGHER